MNFFFSPFPRIHWRNDDDASVGKASEGIFIVHAILPYRHIAIKNL